MPTIWNWQVNQVSKQRSDCTKSFNYSKKPASKEANIKRYNNINLKKNNHLDNITLSTILFHLEMLRDLAPSEGTEYIDCWKNFIAALIQWKGNEFDCLAITRSSQSLKFGRKCAGMIFILVETSLSFVFIGIQNFAFFTANLWSS